MTISLISWTENPVDVIGIAAGTSYGRPLVENHEKRLRRVRQCAANGHWSVFEQASVTFRVECSRACSHQLVRHRLASYCQKSQRYTKLDTDEKWYVIPPSIASDDVELREYEFAMRDCEFRYEQSLRNGAKPEDARYLLPEATKTEITCTMNARTLFHFLTMRTDKAAQWEIRDLANELWNEVAMLDEQWAELMNMWATSDGTA